MNKKKNRKEKTKIKLEPDILHFRLSFYFIGLYLLIANLSIFNSGYSGDDWPNSQTPYWIQWRYDELNIINIFKEALYWTNEWMVGQGRFYPFAWIESRFAFSYFKSPLAYNSYKFFMLVMCEFVFVILIYLLTRSHRLIILIGILMPAFIRYRSDFDPHLAFAGLVPSVLIKVFMSCIFINLAFYRDFKKFKMFIYLAAFTYFAAMCTYELAFLLFPLLIYTFLISKLQTDMHETFFSRSSTYRQILNTVKSKRFRPIFISWLSYAVLVFVFLRPKANPQGAYKLGISMKSAYVFITQLFTGLPIVNLNNIKGISSILLILILTLICYIAVDRTNTFYKRKSKFDKNQEKTLDTIQTRYLLPISIILISCQGLMLSMQPIWSKKANFSHSYLGVLSTEFGSALLFSILIYKYIYHRKIRNEI